MSLLSIIKEDQLSARKAKLTAVSSVLTTLIGEAEMVGKNAGREVSDDEVTLTIQKFVKNINDTLRVLGDADPRSAVLQAEKSTLGKYLPKQLSEEALKEAITSIHAGLSAAGEKVDVGSIMKMLKTRFSGSYDGKLASTLIKAELS